MVNLVDLEAEPLVETVTDSVSEAKAETLEDKVLAV